MTLAISHVVSGWQIRRDFRQLSTMIAINISGTDRHKENLKTALSTTSPPLLVKISRPTQVDFFQETTFQPPWCILPAKIFAHATTPELYLQSDLELRVASSWALPHISSFSRWHARSATICYNKTAHWKRKEIFGIICSFLELPCMTEEWTGTKA